MAALMPSGSPEAKAASKAARTGAMACHRNQPPAIMPRQPAMMPSMM